MYLAGNQFIQKSVCDFVFPMDIETPVQKSFSRKQSGDTNMSISKTLQKSGPIIPSFSSFEACENVIGTNEQSELLNKILVQLLDTTPDEQSCENICSDWLTGCCRNTQCIFKHSRPLSQSSKMYRYMCIFHSKGNCAKGLVCSFAHSTVELHFVTSSKAIVKHKTMICKHWLRNGYCLLGDKCNFAHGINELKRSIIKNIKR